MKPFLLIIAISAMAAAQDSKPDPFAGVAEAPQATAGQPADTSWFHRFFSDGFGFRKEIMSQVDAGEFGSTAASRQSLGLEALKKVSSGTATIASFDVQVRLVRRDGFNPSPNDMEGATRPGWALEYHNVYVDLYNVFNPALSDKQRSDNVGRFNLRAGRFYVPFGLNLQTDTHGTVLQLSNERNFGFERDWYTGFWGSINKHLNYDAYYLTGSGYALNYKGQSGLGAARLSLSNKYSSEYGIEAGLSLLAGERLSPEAIERSPRVAARAGKSGVVETQRAGLDARYRHAVPTGLITFTSEISAGRDLPDTVSTQLYQADYLRASRRWGLATQYRRFQQQHLEADSSLLGEVTWYFRNDVGGSNMHWIKLNIGRETGRQLNAMAGQPRTLITLQYYFYR
jgi:hypothetical protein